MNILRTHLLYCRQVLAHVFVVLRHPVQQRGVLAVALSFLFGLLFAPLLPVVAPFHGSFLLTWPFRFVYAVWLAFLMYLVVSRWRHAPLAERKSLEVRKCDRCSANREGKFYSFYRGQRISTNQTFSAGSYSEYRVTYRFTFPGSPSGSFFCDRCLAAMLARKILVRVAIVAGLAIALTFLYADNYERLVLLSLWDHDSFCRLLDSVFLAATFLGATYSWAYCAIAANRWFLLLLAVNGGAENRIAGSLQEGAVYLHHELDDYGDKCAIGEYHRRCRPQNEVCFTRKEYFNLR
jgi:hypothetical protein